MKVLKKCLQFTLFFYCVTAFAQEFELPENKLIKSSKEDSTILAEVKVVEEQIKIDDEKKYHWYRNGIVNSNIGGYHGQLLNGEYKILDLNNKLLILGRFKLGLKVGQWKYWDNDGNYIRIENWKKGLLHGIVRKFYSNPYWCKLFEKNQINSTFRELYRNLMIIQTEMQTTDQQTEKENVTVAKIVKSHGVTAAKRMHDSNEERQKNAHEQLLNKLYHFFDKIQSLIHNQLVTQSYPKFLTSDIGLELLKLLEMRAEERSLAAEE